MSGTNTAANAVPHGIPDPAADTPPKFGTFAFAVRCTLVAAKPRTDTASDYRSDVATDHRAIIAADDSAYSAHIDDCSDTGTIRSRTLVLLFLHHHHHHHRFRPA